MAAYFLQSLNCPAAGTQLNVNTTYNITFNLPWAPYVSSWWAASDNIIFLYWRDSEGYSQTPYLKEQVLVQGNNTFSFKLADYGLDPNNVSSVSIQVNAYVLVGDYFYSLYFDDGESTTDDWGSSDREFGKPLFYSACGAPTSPELAATISRTAVDLSWGAGSAGTNNSVTGYDVQYRESSDGSSWGSWQAASGSPVTATKLSVAPSSTVGNYRQYRVRTRGSAGESYYSAWVTSTNTLRRKWAAFGAYTDATLVARSSMIRAVHITELQTRVNAIRAFYGLSAYGFTAVTAKTAKIAKWASLIQEIRTAIDAITTSHESWNTLEAGKPRIAHITQIRSIIDNM